MLTLQSLSFLAVKKTYGSPQFLITSKVDLNLLARRTFKKTFIICSPEEEDIERAKYESVYHLYKDAITLYSGEFGHLASVIRKKLYQEHPTAQVYLIPRYTILSKVIPWRVKVSLRTFDKVFITCSPRNEEHERRLFEDLYKSLDKESREKVTLYSGDHKLMLKHIRRKMMLLVEGTS